MPFDASVYDSKHLGRVRQFATANTIQLLVMNIQAFQKDVEEDTRPDEGEHHQPSAGPDVGPAADRVHPGHQPVVVIDEPQNMESEAAAAAIARLNPFCTLRYSATHKRAYNRVVSARARSRHTT